jgi:hypothetical protein
MTLYPNRTFDAEKDFVAIGLVNITAITLAGRATLPPSNFEELLRWMKQPGQSIKVGHPGVGSFGVADYVPELRQGRYISRVTLGQLASHTSGLLLPTDHPPRPDYRYSLSDFLRELNTWTPSEGQEPGKQHTYRATCQLRTCAPRHVLHYLARLYVTLAVPPIDGVELKYVTSSSPLNERMRVCVPPSKFGNVLPST